MNIELNAVDVGEKEILRNLLEKYDYEFSQYDDRDVNPLGLYGYDYLDSYWTEKGRWAFFIRVNQKLAGFVMVSNYSETDERIDNSISEFFVMHKYRGRGVGSYAAVQVFDMFPGKWQLKRHPKNIASVGFWDKVIHEYTGGNYRYTPAHPQAEYDDGSLGDVFVFGSPSGISTRQE
ncbi:MAG: GNAT family N-acetyltransferase [Limnochordia bacterium]|nr:GNAT family N-acetyltransferase [Limnochordia bacterium]